MAAVRAFTTPWWAVVLLATACAEPAPLPTLVDGCTRWNSRHEGQPPSCEHVPQTELRAWVPTEQPPTVEIDGDVVQVETTAVDTGHRVTMTLPAQAKRLKIADGSERAFVLKLVPVETATPTESRARLAYELLQRARGQLRAGQPALATVTATQAVAAAPGHRGLARTATIFAAFVHGVVIGNLEDADELIGSVVEPDPEDARGWVDVFVQRGLIASSTLDVRRALADLTAAERIAERVNSPYRTGAAQERAGLLSELGRAREAAKLLDGLSQERLSTCVRGAVATTAGWARLVARPRFEVERARGLFRTAVNLFTNECPSVADANNARVNLALLELPESPARAQDQLDQISGPEEAEAALWHLAIQAEIHRRSDEADEAKVTLHALRSGARSASHEGLQWQAEVGLARLAEAAGDLSTAAERFRGAEKILDQQVRVVPIFAGQRFLLEDRTESLAGLLRTLIPLKGPDEALAAARRAKRRTLEQLASADLLERAPPAHRRRWLAARSAYQAERDALRVRQEALQAAPGDERARAMATLKAQRARTEEALDHVFDSLGAWSEGPLAAPHPQHLWIVPLRLSASPEMYIFFARGDRVTAVQTPDWPDAAGWGRLLQPHLKGARQVVVFGNPSTEQHTPLARAPWLNSQLGLQIPIRYTVDLPAPTVSSSTSRALIVYDPRGDLADARAEGESVAKLLKKNAREVLSFGPGEAQPAALVETLGQVDLFHYAGHAEFAGPQGWQSRLLLSEGDLSIADLLTLKRAPRWAVLTGCETARSRPGASAAMGLGQALALAGSEQIVATTQRIDSAGARRFSELLYQAWTPSVPLDRAFLSAARSLDSEDLNWTSFVLLTRAP